MYSPDLFLRLGPSPCFLPKRAFLSSRSPTTVFHTKKKKTSSTCLGYYKSPSAAFLSLETDIPKQFRAENLIDGLMDNYKNVPEYLYGNPSAQLDLLLKEDNHFCRQSENLIDGLMDDLKNVPEYLYGLPSSHLDLFLKEDNPFCRQSENLSEEILESYSELAGMDSLYDMESSTSLSDSSASMKYSGRRGGRRRGGRRRRAPDLPSRLLKARVCYLGLPIYTAVADLIVKQLMYMDFIDNKKPIYLYINSFGTQDEDGELVGMETDAFAIADTMRQCKAPIYTVNCGWADGQAAMLLSLGNKGNRVTMKNASARLHLPTAEESHGTSTDLWLRAEELDAYADVYLELLEEGTGRSWEQLCDDIVGDKYLNSEKAVEYGLVDKVVDKIDGYYYSRPKRGIFMKRRRSGLKGTRRQGAGPGTRRPVAIPGTRRPVADPVPV